MLHSLFDSTRSLTSPFAVAKEEVKRVAIVAFSSNSSLCGAFNTNVWKKLNALIQASYPHLAHRDILIFPVGRRIQDAVLRGGYPVMGDFRKLVEKPTYRDAVKLAHQLMELFSTHQVDCVQFVYNHFKNMGVQISTTEVYLPFSLPEHLSLPKDLKWEVSPEYILEPSRDEIVDTLLPKVLELKVFTTLLDSVTAEHAARTVAMQLATENAEAMIDELTLLYNKSRQQAITNELLDIVGGIAR